MIVLGYHGALDALFPRGGNRGAAAIVRDGEVIAACEDEQFACVTRTAAVPEPAIGYVLARAGLHSVADVDLVAFACGGEPRAPSEVLGSGGLDRAQRVGLAIASGAWRVADRLGGGQVARFRRALAQRTGIDLPDERFRAIPAHVAHLAGAFFGSAHERALAVALGTRGDVSLAGAVGRGSRLEELARASVPDSLAHLRAIVARHLGVAPAAIPTLAAGGEPRTHRRFFRSLVRVHRDRVAEVDARLVLDAIARAALRAPVPALAAALGPARRPGEPLSARHADVAAALEETIEVAVLASLAVLAARCGERTLCLSGELAADPGLNGRIARSGLFERVEVAAAPHGPAAAIGAALHVLHHQLGAARRGAAAEFRGPDADDALVGRAIAVHATRIDAVCPADLAPEIAEALGRGEVVAWVQGRAACAASPLGRRSLLADPRHPAIADRLAEITGSALGELAPTMLVPREDAAAWLALDGIVSSPRALFSAPIRPGASGRLGALEGPDGRTRVLTVERDTAPRLHALLREVGRRTGVPVLLEAELRTGGATVPHGPEDAIAALLGAPIDRLVLGDRIVRRRREAALDVAAE